MRKWMSIPLILAVTGATLVGGATAYDRIITLKSKSEASSTTRKVPAVTKQPRAVDPTKHGASDIDLAKKLVLYHELAAKLDDYAKEHAVRLEIRELATQRSAYNTAQANAYGAILRSWNEPYSNLEDFPKIAGASCGSYPTFPGMLTHTDVNAFLQASSEEVDRRYLALMIQHHGDIDFTLQTVNDTLTYGKIIKLRDTFLAARDGEVKEMNQMQKRYGYV